LDFSIIEFLKHIFLGIVQGITEVLPISSSGHVELVKALIGLESDDNIIFLILLNTGSLATFIIIYFKRLLELSKSFFVYIFKKSKRKDNYVNLIYLLKVLIACIPAGIFGLFFKQIFEESLANYAILVSGIGLLITATVIYYVSADNFSEAETNISWTDTLFIGLAQAFAIVPGISRSGMTTSTALKRGNGISSALNFSFLMYIFISIATTGLLVVELIQEGSSISGVQYTYYLFAFLAAMIATYIAYKLIFNIFKSGKLRYFSYYCFAVGLLAILLFII